MYAFFKSLWTIPSISRGMQTKAINTVTGENRSQHGCWTCRLRKRKCDEKVPKCSECLGLRLDCHGYNEKPSWMDRGAKQKAQATKVKQLVAAARRQKRTRTAPGQCELRDHHSTSCFPPAIESSSIPISTTDYHDLSANSLVETALITPPATCSHKSCSGSTIFPELIATTTTLSEHLPDYFMLSSFRPNDTFAPSIPIGNMIESELLAFGPRLSEIGTEPEKSALPLFTSHTFEDSLTFPLDIQFLSSDCTLSDPTSSLEKVVESGQTIGGSIETTTRSMPTIDSMEDALLLAYYFEKVFAWQFQFCGFQMSAFNQGHIMWLVSKSRSLHRVVLALSSMHRRLWKPKSASTCSVNDELTARYCLANKALLNDLKNISPSNEVWLLACIVTMLYSTVSQTIELLFYITETIFPDLT